MLYFMQIKVTLPAHVYMIVYETYDVSHELSDLYLYIHSNSGLDISPLVDIFRRLTFRSSQIYYSSQILGLPLMAGRKP